jgi:hypothetical protein
MFRGAAENAMRAGEGLFGRFGGGFGGGFGGTGGGRGNGNGDSDD